MAAGNRCHFVLLDKDESCPTTDLSNTRPSQWSGLFNRWAVQHAQQSALISPPASPRQSQSLPTDRRFTQHAANDYLTSTTCPATAVPHICRVAHEKVNHFISLSTTCISHTYWKCLTSTVQTPVDAVCARLGCDHINALYIFTITVERHDD